MIQQMYTTTRTDGNSNGGNLSAAGGTIKVSGEVRDTAANNIVAAGLGSVVTIDSAYITGATLDNFKTLSGGKLNYIKPILDRNEVHSGQFTATAGSITTVTNSNVVSADSITLQPRNSAARAFSWNISSIVEGVSFTVNFSGSLAGTEIFSYQLG